MYLKQLILTAISLIHFINGAKLLGISSFPAISHTILMSKLMQGLSDAGHDVTFVTPHKSKFISKKGKYTEVFLDGAAEDFQEHLKTMNLFETNNEGIFQKILIFFRLINTINFISEKTITHPKMQQIVKSESKFDAVLMEHFLNDGLKVFSYVFDCPLILLSSFGPSAMINPTVGNPEPISYVPHLYLGLPTNKLSFKQRALNLFQYILADRMIHWFALSAQNKIIHQHFPNAPSLYDLYTNVSLVLLSSHTSTNAAVPIVPNMVEIGGYFIDPPKKLPQDLQEFMDNATEGVIYFSMGSNLKSKDMTPERKQIFLNIFRKLKQKIIWKFEEDLEGKPEYVLIQKWCPQQDILAHPNVKLFITHGGLLSTTETIYHGVPILAIPVFADQPINAAKAENAGYGRTLNYHDPEFSEEKLEALIKDLLDNTKYTENAKRRQRIFHDRPMKPLETMIYWVEYVVRHKGAPHLRVAGINLSWYKYFLLDVLSVVFIIVAIIASLIIFTIKKIIRKPSMCKSSAENKRKSE